MKNRLYLIIVALLMFGLVACNSTKTTKKEQTSSVVYVNTHAKGNNDGSSWKNAYKSLQFALVNANQGDQIWVAKGTYYPTQNADPSVSFTMVDNVDLYGGFDGTETSITQRDWTKNVTILSGDIGIKGDTSDNSVKVVIAANSVIDGVTISDGAITMRKQPSMTDQNNQTAMKSNNTEQGRPPMGQQNGTRGQRPPRNENSSNQVPESESNSVGHSNPGAVTAGTAATSSNGNGIIIWEVAPTIRNCIITNNQGGKGAGVYIQGTKDLDKIPTFINTTISNNVATMRGGGVSIDMSSSAIFIDCIFDNNECIEGKGGAIYNDFGCSPLLENCLFINNKAQSGAALGNDGESSPAISHCTFYNNTASEAGAALYQGTGPFNDPIVINSITWGKYCTQDKMSVYNWNECNPQIDYSIVEQGYDGTNIIDANPNFTDVTIDTKTRIASGNFSYDKNSVAYGAGSDGKNLGYDAKIVSTRTENDYKTITTYLKSIKNNKKITEMDLSNPVKSSDASYLGTTVFVNLNATGANNGSSWENAFTSLQNAIDYAGAAYSLTNQPVDIWVAKGTYTTGNKRSDSFILRSGVTLYGGFNGTETSLAKRNSSLNLTILSAEIGDTSIKTDNSYHVVIGADKATIDGFTITAGYADGIDGQIYDNKGGGLINYLAGDRVRPNKTPTLGFDTVIVNCTFSDNYAEEGGASYTYHGGNPQFTNCTFINNKAQYGGSTVDRAGTNAKYTDCSFSKNSAVYKGGATFTDYGSMSSFYNCSFSNNKSGTAGGAIYVIDRASQEIPNKTNFALIDSTWNNTTDIFSAVYVENSTFTANTAGTHGGAMYIYDGSYAKIVDSNFTKNVASDAAITANNSAKIYIDIKTIFNANAPKNTLIEDKKSSITFN